MITSGRVTTITLDTPELTVPEPAWNHDRLMDKIQGDPDLGFNSIGAVASSNVMFVRGVGWVLRPASTQGNQLRELNLPTLPMNVPANWVAQSRFTQASTPGATYASGVTGQDLYYTRMRAAGDNVTGAKYCFPSDYSNISVVGPAYNCNMQRVGISSSVYDPNAMHTLSFYVPDALFGSPDYVMVDYFPGPLGYDLDADSIPRNATGYYAAMFTGDGFMELWQQNYLVNNSATIAWKFVKRKRYAAADQVAGRLHRIVIFPQDDPGLPGSSSGGSIMFRFETHTTSSDTPTSGSYQHTVGTRPHVQGNDQGSHFNAEWNAGRISGAQSRTAQPIRIDIRADCPCQWQVNEAFFATSGVLADTCVPMNFLPGASQNIKMIFWANVPSTCTLNVSLYALYTNPATPSQPTLTSLSIISGTGGSGTVFETFPGVDKYIVAFSYTGNGTATPQLYGYRFQRGGTSQVTAPGSFTPATVRSPSGTKGLRTSSFGNLRIQMADSNPASSSATFHIDDFNASFPALQYRGEFPISISTTFQSPFDGSTQTAILHRGYCSPVSEEQGNHDEGWAPGFTGRFKANQFDTSYRFRVSLTSEGAWLRLNEGLLSFRWNMNVDDPTSGIPASFITPQPAAVTTAMINLLQYAGFPPSMINIPNLPTTFQGQIDGDAWMIEPQSNISEILTRLARDYFGGYLYFEPNLGSYGMWCLILPKVSPYTYAYSFQNAGPGSGKSDAALVSYGTVTVGSGATAQTVPVAPIHKGTKFWKIKKPEGNVVVALGPGENNGANKSHLASQVLYNFNSFYFSQIATSPPNPVDNPDYLPRAKYIWVYSPNNAAINAATGSSMLQFIARRMYDIACHGYIQKKFSAPLCFCYDTTTMPGTGFWRPLRFYDVVLVDGVACVIRDINVHYDKDWNQIADYYVEQIQGAQPLLTISSISPNPRHPDRLHGVVNGIVGQQQGEKTMAEKQFGHEKRHWGQASDALGFGAKSMVPVQRSDGTFYYMMGYDPLP